jgi:hypothetical protein
MHHWAGMKTGLESTIWMPKNIMLCTHSHFSRPVFN